VSSSKLIEPSIFPSIAPMVTLPQVIDATSPSSRVNISELLQAMICEEPGRTTKSGSSSIKPSPSSSLFPSPSSSPKGSSSVRAVIPSITVPSSSKQSLPKNMIGGVWESSVQSLSSFIPALCGAAATKIPTSFCGASTILRTCPPRSMTEPDVITSGPKSLKSLEGMVLSESTMFTIPSKSSSEA